MDWEALPKPAEMAESRLITAILEGHFDVGQKLPAERELAAQLGVTRPTLREALQRLARDGWLDISHGRSTRVKDYWREGNLGVLSAIARFPAHAPANFVPNLLAVRRLMAPSYTRDAVRNAPEQVTELLVSLSEVENTPQAYTRADWLLHHRLTVLSGNPIFTLILNGFKDLYRTMGELYFTPAAARAHSSGFYRELLAAVQAVDLDEVESLTRRVMTESLELWRMAVPGGWNSVRQVVP